MYPHHPSYITHARSRAHLTPYQPTVYRPHKSSIAAYQVIFIFQPKDGHCQVPKHVVVLYIINSIHNSTIK